MRDNRDTLKLCYEAIREDGASVDQCVERFHAVAVVEQLRALPALASLEKSLPSSSDQANREKRFSEFVSNPPRRRGIFNLLFGTPRRGAAVGVIALLAITGGATAAASLTGGSDAEDGPSARTEAGGCGPDAAAQLAEDEFIVCEWGRARGFAHDRDGAGNAINASPSALGRARDVRSVSDVGNQVLVVRKDGSVTALLSEPPDNGRYNHVEFETLRDVREIEALLLKEDGTVWIWNELALWGIGREDLADHTWSEAVRVDELVDIVDIDSKLALDENGAVFEWAGWKFAGCGSPGRDQEDSAPGPRLVSGLPPIAQISAGAGFSLALDHDGVLWSWGHDHVGQLGDGEPMEDFVQDPVQVDLSLLPEGVRVTAISAGSCHSFAVLSDGSMIVWGYEEESGVLGNGPPAGPEYLASPAFVDLRNVPGDPKVVEVDSGRHSSSPSALLSDGRVLTWGDDSSGQLGNGMPLGDSSSPLLVPDLVGVRFLAGGLALVGRCAAPDCQQADSPVTEDDPPVLSVDDLPFTDGGINKNLTCPQGLDTPGASASSEDVEASQLYVDLAPLADPIYRGLMIDGLICDGVVSLVSIGANVVPVEMAGLSLTRFYFRDEKPSLRLAEGLTVVADPAAISLEGDPLLAQPVKIAGQQAMFYGTARYGADGTFDGWADTCSVWLVERSPTETLPGIAWAVTGLGCDSGALIIEQLLVDYSAERNDEAARKPTIRCFRQDIEEAVLAEFLTRAGDDDGVLDGYSPAMELTRQEAEDYLGFEAMFPTIPEAWSSITRVFPSGGLTSQCNMETVIGEPGITDTFEIDPPRGDSFEFTVNREATLSVEAGSQTGGSVPGATETIALRGTEANLYTRHDDPAIFISWTEDGLVLQVSCSLLITREECIGIAESVS